MPDIAGPLVPATANLLDRNLGKIRRGHCINCNRRTGAALGRRLSNEFHGEEV
jgi:hypothetical protein